MTTKELEFLKPKQNKNKEIGSSEILLPLKDGRLAMASYQNNTIKIIDITDNFNCHLTLSGHTQMVKWIIQLENEKLVSNSEDNTIIIWNITKYTYNIDFIIKNVYEKTCRDYCCLYQLSNQRFATAGYYDHKIQIYNSNKPYNLIQTLTINEEDKVHLMIQLKGTETLLTFPGPQKWNLTTYQCEMKLNCLDTVRPHTIIEMNNKLIVPDGFNKISIFDLSTYTIECQIKNEKFGTIQGMILLDDDTILAGNFQELLIKINLKTKNFEIGEAESNVKDIVKIKENQIGILFWKSLLILDY